MSLSATLIYSGATVETFDIADATDTIIGTLTYVKGDSTWRSHDDVYASLGAALESLTRATEKVTR